MTDSTNVITNETQRPRAGLIGCETGEGECRQHGSYPTSVLVLASGKRIPGRCPECQKAEREREQASADLRRLEARQRAIETLIRAAGIPPRFASRTFENFRATTPGAQRALRVCRAYATNFNERLRYGGGLVMAGKPGTGKTHLAAAISQVVIAQGRSAVLTTATKATRLIKETYAKGSTMSERDALRTLLKPDLLVLDEVGMQIGSDTEVRLLSEIVNDRYCEMRPTILITNLTARELVKFVGERTLSRMEEGGGVTLAFDWASYRPQAARDPALPWPEPAPVDYDETLKRWT